MKTQNTLIPRIKPKIERRELNDKEKLMAVFAVGECAWFNTRS